MRFASAALSGARRQNRSADNNCNERKFIMSVIPVNENNFEREIINADLPVLADFYADWCGPCRMLRPTLEAIAADRSDVKVAAVNIDENPDLADEFDISSIPCVILFKNGAEADRSIGLVPREALEDMLG